MKKPPRFIITGIYDKGEEGNEEFHITPCITYSREIRYKIKGYGIALEWGYWALLFIYIKPYKL